MRSLFGCPRSHSTIQRSLFELYTFEPTMFPMSCSSGGMKELFVFAFYVGCVWGLTTNTTINTMIKLVERLEIDTYILYAIGKQYVQC